VSFLSLGCSWTSNIRLVLLDYILSSIYLADRETNAECEQTIVETCRLARVAGSLERAL
jgi:hypothetical protein